MADGTWPVVLHLRAFGGLSLANGGRPLVGAASQRGRLAMLAVLACVGDRGVSRDVLLALFWPEKDADSARGALRQALYKLRLDAEEPLLTVGTTELKLNAAVIGSDVGEFDAEFKAGNFERAVDRYTGPLLHGIHLGESPEFERWADRERERRVDQYRTALERLATAANGRGDFRTAADLKRKLASSDPLSAAFANAAIRALARAGERPAALQYLREYQRRVQSEFDLPLDPTMAALSEELRTTEVAPASRADRAVPVVPAPVSPTDDLTRRRPEELDVEPTPETRRLFDDAPAQSVADRSPVTTGRRMRSGPLIAVGLLASVVAALFLNSRSDASGELRDNFVVVAPVTVLAADLDLWREGMVDVLSRSLDGAGDVRAVAAAIVMKAADGPDADTPEELAYRTRAGIVLIGTLQRTGVDSARFTVTVRDVARQVTRGEIDRRNAIDRMDHLADTVAIDVLRVLLRGTGRRSPALRSVGTASFIALKEFLQGQVFYRRTLWDSSETHFLRAIALDPTFALPYAGMARALEQRPVARAVPDASHYAFLAAALNRGLGLRDSALIALDSVYLAAYSNPQSLPRDPQLWPHIRRAIAAAERLVSDYPDDAEVWVKYAEVLYHLGGVATGTGEQQVLDAFDRAIALDPALGPAYSHVGTLALLLRGREGLRRYGVSAVRNGIGTAARDQGFMNDLERLASSNPDRARRALDTISVDVLWANYQSVAAVDADATLLPAATSRLRIAIRDGTLNGVSESALSEFNVRALLKSGRFAEAAGIVDAKSQPSQFASAAILGALPDHRVQPVFAEWLTRAALPFECLRLLDWWAQRRDAVSIGRCTARRVRELQADTSSGVRRMARPVADLGAAFGALARRDTSGAVRMFDAFPDSLCPVWCWFAIEPRVRLLSSVGRRREAFDLATRRSHVDFAFSAMTVPVALARARLAAQLGDHPVAIAAYRVVAEVWAHADSSLQPIVSEAHSAINRLGGALRGNDRVTDRKSPG